MLSFRYVNRLAIELKLCNNVYISGKQGANRKTVRENKVNTYTLELGKYQVDVEVDTAKVQAVKTLGTIAVIAYHKPTTLLRKRKQITQAVKTLRG